jgi:hypothetical protein
MPEFLDRLLEFPLNDIEIFFGHAANFITCVSGKEYGGTPTTIVPLTQHDYRKREILASCRPWFRLWQRYGVCCRPESPVIRLGDTGN